MIKFLTFFREFASIFSPQNLFQNRKTIFQTLFVVGMLVSIVLAVVLVKREQIFKSKAAAPRESQLAVGFDVTGIIHYGNLLPSGNADLYPFSRADAPRIALKEIQRLGGKIVRVFAANSNISDEEAARRLDEFLTLADNYGVQVIVSLTNFYRDDNELGNYPQGARPYFKVVDSPNYGRFIILSSEFFQSGYKTGYLPFVRIVIERNKYHNNIYAWEIGNELRDEGNPQAFIAFMQDTIQTIKSIDSRHAVSSGMMGLEYNYPKGPTPDEFYSQLPQLDIVSVTDYDNDHRGEADILWAVSHGKRAILSELGFSSGGNRSSLYKQSLEYWKSRGVEAVLVWGFLPKQLRGDNGNGDSRLGMDAIWHKDYDQIADVLTGRGVVASTPTPTPTPEPTISPSSVPLTPVSVQPSPVYDPNVVTTCKGERLTWDQLDSALHGANYPGPFDHSQSEIDAYNRAACPGGNSAPAGQQPTPARPSAPALTCEYSEPSSNCRSGFHIVTGTGCNGFNCEGCRFVGGYSTVRCSDAPTPVAPAAPAPQPASQPSSACPAMTCEYSEPASSCASGFQIVSGTGCGSFNCAGCTYVSGCSTVRCSD